MTSDEQYYSTTLEKGLKVFSLFNSDHPGLTQTEIAKLTGINPTSVYRFVNTLVSLGYLSKDPQSKRVTPGTAAVLLANNILACSDLVQNVRPLIDEFFSRHNMTMDLALVDGDHLFIAYRRMAHGALSYHFPNLLTDLNCLALGKAFLAHLPREEMERILAHTGLARRTPDSIADPGLFSEEIARVRRQGYAIGNEEFIPGLLALAAPVFDSQTERVMGAVSVNGHTAQHTMEVLEREFAGKIVNLAEKISEVLPVIPR